MTSCLIRTVISVLFISLIFSIVVTSINANSEAFPPPDGTTSTYRWDFEGFKVSGALNDTHIDQNNIEAADSFDMLNPTHAEFTVSYSTFGEFLEESIDGVMYNTTHSLRFMPSFLVAPTTRIYVNEDGEASDQATVGYIDPNNINLGMQIQIEDLMANVTAKENLNVANTNRKAWKLVYISELLNITSFYDTETGILLKLTFKIIGGEIGEERTLMDYFSRNIFQIKAEEINTRIQTLLSTNAWDTDKNGLILFAEPMILLMGLIILSVIHRVRK